MPVPTIDGEKLTPGKAVIVPTCRGHRPGKRRGVPRGRARADDRRREADAGQLGKVVIDLASAGTSPAAVPVVPTIDGGKLTPGNSARRSSTWQAPGPFRGRARAARGADVPPRSPWCRRSTPGIVPSPGKPVIVPPVVPTCRACRRSTPASSKGKLTPARRSSTWQRAAVPVVPTIDAGQFQGQAGHRAARGADVPRVPTIDGGKRAESGQAGYRPGNVPPVVPIIDAGKLTPASWLSCHGPRGADDRRRAS